MTFLGDIYYNGIHLRPIDKKIFDKGFQINIEYGNTFSYLDFPELDYGTFRNSIVRLRKAKLAYTIIPSHPAQYACKGSGIKPELMTQNHMVGSGHSYDLDKLLFSLGDAVAFVHNLHIKFYCSDIYNKLKLRPNKFSKDKKLSTIEFEKGRSANIISHLTGTVSIKIACSDQPFPCENLCELLLILESIKNTLVANYHIDPRQIPLIGEWVLSSWHYNKDGQKIAGEQYEVTIRNFQGILYRFYSKFISKNIFQPRFEKIESPRKPLKEIVSELLDNTHFNDHSNQFIGIHDALAKLEDVDIGG